MFNNHDINDRVSFDKNFLFHGILSRVMQTDRIGVNYCYSINKRKPLLNTTCYRAQDKKEKKEWRESRYKIVASSIRKRLIRRDRDSSRDARGFSIRINTAHIRTHTHIICGHTYVIIHAYGTSYVDNENIEHFSFSFSWFMHRPCFPS